MTAPSRVALLVLASLPLSAAAEQWRGVGETTLVGSEEQRENGALVACNISFTQVFADDVHRKGATVTAKGVLAMVKPAPRRFAFVLKMVGEDQGRVASSSGSPFSPSSAYVSVAGYTSAHRASQTFKCDGPGYCAAFANNSDMTGLLGVALSRSFNAAYQRRPGTLDTSFLVRLAPETSPASPANDRFADCARSLVGSPD